MLIIDGLSSIRSVRRTEIVRARLTTKEKKQVVKFAKSAKVTESDVVRYALLRAGVIAK